MHFEHKLEREHWTVSSVLEWQACSNPEKPFIIMAGGESMTFGEARDEAVNVAGLLNELEVQPGDRVAVMLHNGLDFIRAWAGIARLGAVMVALNTELVGGILQSQIERSKARIAIVGERCLQSFSEANQTSSGGYSVERILIAGVFDDAAHTPNPTAGVQRMQFSEWRETKPYVGEFAKPSDIACILYTSGTTGPSKGVMLPHAHCYLYGLGAVENCLMTSEDINYLVLPLYHVNGLFMHVYSCLIAGATIVLRERFSVSSWLDDLLEYGATMTCVVGAITAFVFAQEETLKERSHKLRFVMAGPNLVEHEKVWIERFAVPEVLSCYGMTECNMVTWGRLGETRSGSVGKVYAEFFEALIVDPETDREVPRGSIGELIVRPREPFCFMAGYDGMPEKTVEASRNFWFHTGDAAVMDEDGYVFFLDRLGDRIRRRGENVSSFEIEDAILRLQAVREAAAYAIPSELKGGEDEIMVALVLNEPANADLRELIDAVTQSLPRFARPRYFRVVEELPKTKTHKIQKGQLRAQGITNDTRDALQPHKAPALNS